MSGFVVQPGDVFAAGARVGEAAQDGRAAVSRVRLEADGVFAGGWRGRAADGFADGLEDWFAGVERMLTGLDELASALGAAARDYERAEQANDTTMTRLVS